MRRSLLLLCGVCVNLYLNNQRVCSGLDKSMYYALSYHDIPRYHYVWCHNKLLNIPVDSEATINLEKSRVRLIPGGAADGQFSCLQRTI